jgi:serine protease Do
VRTPAFQLLTLALLAVAATPAFGQLDREAIRLRDAIKDDHFKGVDDTWVYNDIEAARKEARRTGKPMFVTFRCVPCKACAGFDAEVANGSAKIQQIARNDFVAVRQVEMKGVDLDEFQFDCDLNWAAMFVNADGTVYARYGTQSAEGPDAYNSVEGLVSTMNKVLELHANYPKNKAELAGKRGAKRSYSSALEMPGMLNKEKLEGTTLRNNCIHCHMIHDAQNRAAHEGGTYTHDMLWRYPYPENVGLEIDAADGCRIAAVEKGSPAERAGLKKGEDVTHVNGQAIASIADVQWVLHGLPNENTTVKVTGSESGERTLALEKGWKEYDVSWRASIHSVSPQLNVWMPPVEAAKRRQLQLPADQPALEVKWINRERPSGRAAFESGLRQGDVVLAIDGQPLPADSRQFVTHVKLNYEAGDVLPLTILRGGKRQEVRVKLVE